MYHRQRRLASVVHMAPSSPEIFQMLGVLKAMGIQLIGMVIS
jgi:hypothetical protein